MAEITPEQAKTLEAPFDPKVLKVKQGLSYVPSHQVIARLNAALGVGAWSWEIVEWQIMGEDVAVVGRLTVPGATYMGADVHQIMHRQNSDQRVPDGFANALKGADSGAFKRAARNLGPGLDLYRAGAATDAEIKDVQEAQRAEAEEQARKQRRHELLVKIGREMKRLNWSTNDVLVWCDGKSPRELDMDELEARAAEIVDLDPAAQARRYKLLEAARPLGWALDSVDRAIEQMLKVWPEQLTRDGEAAVLKHILVERARRAADRLGMSKEQLEARLGGAPVTVEAKALEAAVSVLEAEAEQRGR